MMMMMSLTNDDDDDKDDIKTIKTIILSLQVTRVSSLHSLPINQARYAEK